MLPGAEPDPNVQGTKYSFVSENERNNMSSQRAQRGKARRLLRKAGSIHRLHSAIIGVFLCPNEGVLISTKDYGCTLIQRNDIQARQRDFRNFWFTVETCGWIAEKRGHTT